MAHIIIDNFMAHKNPKHNEGKNSQLDDELTFELMMITREKEENLEELQKEKGKVHVDDIEGELGRDENVENVKIKTYSPALNQLSIR